MVALRRFEMADLARQKRLDVDLEATNELTPGHTVGQAVGHYLNRMQIPDHGLNWIVCSRGVAIDNKLTLGDLAPQDDQLTVMPEVAAGAAPS